MTALGVRHGLGRLAGAAALAVALIILAPAIAAAAGCKDPLPAIGRSIDSGAVAIDDHKPFQPLGGAFALTITPTKALPADARVITCFQWYTGKSAEIRYLQGPTVHVTEFPADRTSIVVAAPVPDALNKLDEGEFTKHAGIFMTRAALLRVLVVTADGRTLVDEVTEVGISRVSFAIIAALLATALVISCAYLLRAVRSPRRGDLQSTVAFKGFFLPVIATSSGYASLSQFQIILWTVLVGASAVYVIVLSGDLLPISQGTLVLLGIAGVATLGAQLNAKTVGVAKAKAEAEAEPTPEAAAKAAEDAKAKAAADAQALAAGPAHVAPSLNWPKWSDLITSEETVATADGMRKVEVVDVTRVQMLFFTVIVAVFVILRVATSYAIPDIPEQYLLLMGISNGVYLVSKWTAPDGKPPAKPAE